MDKINVAIAGFGYSAQIFHTTFLKDSEMFCVKRVYTRKHDKVKELLPNTQIVNVYEELICDEVELIIICTPNSLHYEMAKLALENRKHVVIEKPITTNSLEAEKLYRISEKNNSRIFVYQNRRFDGDFIVVKNIFEQKILGEILDYECHFDRYVSGEIKKEWKKMEEKGIIYYMIWEFI